LKAKSISSSFAFLQRASHCGRKSQAEKGPLKMHLGPEPHIVDPSTPDGGVFGKGLGLQW